MDFRGAPGSFHVTICSFVGTGCLDLVRGTLLAEREDQLVVAGHRQNGEVVLRQCLHGTLDNTLIVANIFEVGNDDFRMSNGISFVLVDCGIQGDDVDVLNFLVSGDLVQQL